LDYLAADLVDERVLRLVSTRRLEVAAEPAVVVGRVLDLLIEAIDAFNPGAPICLYLARLFRLQL
jgi:hypothetical protein